MSEFECLYSGDRYDPNDYPPRYRSNATPQFPDDEFDPGCTRTLFVGNIEKTTAYGDLKEAFERFGEVVVSILMYYYGHLYTTATSTQRPPLYNNYISICQVLNVWKLFLSIFASQ